MGISDTTPQKTKQFSNHEPCLLLRSHTFAIIVILDLKIHQSMWIQWPFFQKLKPEVIDPKKTSDSKSVVTCVTLPKDHCVQVPQKYIKVSGYSVPFFKNLNQRSFTPRWPLTPCLLRSHVWHYPRIIVSKSHGNTSDWEITSGITYRNFRPIICGLSDFQRQKMIVAGNLPVRFIWETRSLTFGIPNSEALPSKNCTFLA